MVIDMINSEIRISRVGESRKPAYGFLSHKSMNSLSGIVRKCCKS